MEKQELLFLGLLREGPKHGYEIKKEIISIISNLSGLKPKSIYYSLRKMEKRGLVIKKTVKSGRRPEKYVYKLTPKGIERFELLLTKSLTDVERPIFNFDLSLYFLSFIKKDIVRRRLSARLKILRKVEKGMCLSLNEYQKSKNNRLALIFEHDLDMIRAEQNSLKRLMGKI